MRGERKFRACCLKQYPDDLMLAWAVSSRVNTPKNNDSGLIEAIPVPLETIPSTGDLFGKRRGGLSPRGYR